MNFPASLITRTSLPAFLFSSWLPLVPQQSEHKPGFPGTVEDGAAERLLPHAHQRRAPQHTQGHRGPLRQHQRVRKALWAQPLQHQETAAADTHALKKHTITDSFGNQRSPIPLITRQVNCFEGRGLKIHTVPTSPSTSPPVSTASISCPVMLFNYQIQQARGRHQGVPRSRFGQLVRFQLQKWNTVVLWRDLWEPKCPGW